MQIQTIVQIIDSLAPVNNSYRREKNSIKKIELMWKLGAILNNNLQKYNVTLDELLYSLYDPHSTIKRSNITRSLGAYSYRVYNYFKQKNDIKRLLSNLKSYNVFIEALPLLTNKKYIPYVNNDYILSLINSQDTTKNIDHKLNSIKQSISPSRTLRISPVLLYREEKKYLNNIIIYVSSLYKTINTLRELENSKYNLASPEFREQLVIILMSLASDTFTNKINIIKKSQIYEDLNGLYMISVSNTENRARFRKWVLSSNKLLWLAEAVHALGSENDLHFFKKKLEK